MPRKGEMFAGLTVALVTPFKDDGAIDYRELDGLVDWHIEQGTECLAPMGTTGESPTVDHEEHRRVIAPADPVHRAHPVEQRRDVRPEVLDDGALGEEAGIALPRFREPGPGDVLALAAVGVPAVRER